MCVYINRQLSSHQQPSPSSECCFGKIKRENRNQAHLNVTNTHNLSVHLSVCGETGGVLSDETIEARGSLLGGLSKATRLDK